MKNVVVYLFVSLCLLLNACEYETGENFIEVKKPSDKPVQMKIELSMDNVGEELFIYEPVPIGYRIEVEGHPFLKCNFSIGTVKVESNDPTGNIYLAGENLPDGDYTLTCEIYVRSGSGSIADQVGGEAYLGTYSWPVHIVINERPEQSFSGHLNSDGYLEFTWKKPAVSPTAFAYYKLTDVTGKEIIIEDLNQESYVCKSYVGQLGYYSLKAYFKNPQRTPWDMGLGYMDEQDVHFTVDFPALDSMRISWNNPYKSVAKVNYQNEWVAEEWSDNSITLPYTSFGNSVQAEVSFLPFDKADRTEWSTYYPSLDNRLLNMGVLVYPGGNTPNYGYNPVDNALYVSSYGEVTSWELPACVKNSLFSSPSYENVGNYAISVHSTRMAAQHVYEIEIFEEKKMQEWKTATVEYPASFCGKPTLTDDGKLVAFISESQAVKGIVYDAATIRKEKEFMLPKDVWHFNYGFATPDARFVYYENKNELNVGDLTDYQFRLLYKLPQGFTSWCVDPLHSERLFVAVDGKIRMYDCSAGFSVTRTFDYPGMNVCNIDPETGYLLLSAPERLLVIDPQNGKELFSMQKQFSTFVQLWGNCLCAGNSAVVSIEKYMKK